MSFEELMTSLYYDPSKPTAFAGVEKLYKAGKKLRPSLKRDEVRDWLSAQEAYTLHKKAQPTYPRRPTIVSGAGEQLQADMLDVRSHSRANGGINFLLTAIDCFSRKGYAYPVKSKGGDQVASALEKILHQNNYRVLQTDKGKEFYNWRVKELLKRYRVEHFSTDDDKVKASMVERFNRTLREKIHRYLTAKKSHGFLDVLQKFVDSYNETEHSSIGMAPNDVGDHNQSEVFDELYESKSPVAIRQSGKTPLRVGDTVRIAKARDAFERGYTPNWTKELFKVSAVVADVRPVVYKLVDMSGEDILGTFYRQEVQKVKDQRVYDVEKVMRTRKKGTKKQYFVKWAGYPDTFNSWVDEVDLK
jgi:hypothetical protein